MKKLYILFFIFIFCSLFSLEPLEKKLIINNSILTKIGDKTISVLDVKKRMDFLFHKSYPHLSDTKEAKIQFYLSSWKYVFLEMVNSELLMLEAEKKEVKLLDSEIKEAMAKRFGPNISLSLKNLSLSYTQAFQMIRKEMLTERMMWFFIHSKAQKKITPQILIKNYHNFLEKNPPVENWTYSVLTIKEKDLADEIYNQIHSSKKDFEEIKKELTKNYQHLKISDEYTVNSKEISSNLKKNLSHLKENSYSMPSLHTSRFENKQTYKIFYLKNYSLKTPPSFQEISNKLREEIFQVAFKKESENYFSNLKKYYNYEDPDLENITPFIIK